nr:flippase [Chloroflexota bacterium]
MTINAAKVVARNSISLIGAELAARIVSFTVAVLLIRYLGSVELGKYSFIITYVGLFGFAIDLGVGQLVIRDVSRDKSIAPKYLGNFLLLQSILSAAMLLLLILSINLAGYPSLVKQAVYIAGLGVVIASFATPFAAMASAFEKMHFNALVAIFCATLNSLLTLAVIFLQKGLLSLVWVFLLNHLLRMMIFGWLCTRYCTRPQFGIDFSLWKYLLTSTIPFALIMILGILFNKIDVIMLSKMKGDAAVGWYSAAYKFIDVLIIIPVSINGAIFPLLSRQFVTSRDRLESTLRKSLKYQADVGLPIAVGTTLLADKFI